MSLFIQKTASFVFSLLIGFGLIPAPVAIHAPEPTPKAVVQKIVKEELSEDKTDGIKKQLDTIMQSALAIQKRAEEEKPEVPESPAPIAVLNYGSPAPTPINESPVAVSVQEVPAPEISLPAEPAVPEVIPDPEVSMSYATTTLKGEPYTLRIISLKFSNLTENLVVHKIKLRIISEDSYLVIRLYGSTGGPLVGSLEGYRIGLQTSTIENIGWIVGNNGLISLFSKEIPASLDKFRLIIEEIELQGSEGTIVLPLNLETPEIVVLD